MWWCWGLGRQWLKCLPIGLWIWVGAAKSVLKSKAWWHVFVFVVPAQGRQRQEGTWGSTSQPSQTSLIDELGTSKRHCLEGLGWYFWEWHLSLFSGFHRHTQVHTHIHTHTFTHTAGCAGDDSTQEVTQEDYWEYKWQFKLKSMTVSKKKSSNGFDEFWEEMLSFSGF